MRSKNANKLYRQEIKRTRWSAASRLVPNGGVGYVYLKCLPVS